MSEDATKWWEYRQNNTGGTFNKPYLDVWVEAVNKDHADLIAERNGVYFDGVQAGRDCGCCGDRWSKAYMDGAEAPDRESPAKGAFTSGPLYKGLGRLLVSLNGDTEVIS